MLIHTMPAADLMERWRPGSYGPTWTWSDELEDILKRDMAGFVELQDDVRSNGVKEPVLLGDDGRVWDGHHRILAAKMVDAVVPYMHGGLDG